MKGFDDDADYLSTAPRSTRPRPAWLRLGIAIVLIFAVTGGIATAIGLSTQKLYEAEAELELITPEGIGEDKPVPLPAERIAAARSAAVATRAVTQAGLLEDARFLAAHPELNRADLGLAERRVRAASILLSSMGTRIRSDSSLAAITYRAADPALAADIADALALAFVPVDAERLAGAMDDSRAELEQLVAEVRSELEEAERKLAEGMSEADIIALPAPEAGIVGNGAAPGEDLLSAQAREALESQLAMVRARLAGVEAAIASGAIDTSDPVIAQLQATRDELEEQYQRVIAQFREDYPAAMNLRERIDVIDAQLARESLRVAESRAAEAEQLRIQEADIRAQIAALDLEAASRGTAGLALDEVQQDILKKRELYNLLLARLAQAQDVELPTTARVIGPALAPTRPVVPDWPLLLGAAAGVALLLSIALIVVDVRRQHKTC